MRLSIAAYAYEYNDGDMPLLMTDHEFDAECLKVDLSVDTGDTLMDDWFRKNFDPHTGSWICSHPKLNRIKEIYHAYHNRPN